MVIGSLKAASDFESSFAGVRKTVDATEEEFKALAAEFRDLAKEIPVSVNELNRLGEAAGQLGIQKGEITEFTRVMALLGVTTNLSSEEAATSLARLASVMQLPAAEFENLGSAIVGLGNTFETTEAEIVDFATRIAGVGNIAGLTVPDVLAIGAAFTSVGVQAERGGTAVQKALLGMIDAVSNGGDALDGFAAIANVTGERFATVFRDDASAAFELFVTGVAAQGERAGAMLKDVGLGSERARGAFLSLAGAGDKMGDAFRRATTDFKDNIALADEARKRFETFASQTQLLKNLIVDLGITMGNLFLPVVSAVVSGLQELLTNQERLTAVTLNTASGVVLLIQSVRITNGVFLGWRLATIEVAKAMIALQTLLPNADLERLGIAMQLLEADSSAAAASAGEVELALRNLITEIREVSQSSVEESVALNRVNDSVRVAQEAIDAYTGGTAGAVAGTQQLVVSGSALAAQMDEIAKKSTPAAIAVSSLGDRLENINGVLPSLGINISQFELGLVKADNEILKSTSLVPA